MKTDYRAQEHKSIRAQALVTCAIVAYAFVAAFGDEINVCELNPVSLLAADSEHWFSGDEEPGLSGIQMLPYIHRLNFDASVQQFDNPPANFITAVKNPLLQASAPPAVAPVVQLERKLWKKHISPLSQRPANDKTDQLKQMIEQIRSIQFESQQTPQHTADTTATSVPEPNPDTNGTPTFEPEAQPLPAAPQPQTPAKAATDRTLQMVEELLKDPNTIANPFELAEVLFRSGRPGPAGLCYKQVLASINAADPNMACERAWILFQIGNCLKYDDPNTSKESYAELIRTQPDSPWADVARSRYDLVDWYQQNQPGKLILELKQ